MAVDPKATHELFPKRLKAPLLRVGRAPIVALRNTNYGLMVLAILVGAGGGLGAVAFRWLIKVFTYALCGRADCSITGHTANPYVPGLGKWFLLLAPIVAGLIYGPLVYRFAKEARGHGVPEVMYAVALKGGRIAPQVALIKALASALCIGGGGSVGREGPIVQIGSALGSTLGRVVRVAESRMRVLVACGAAAGIAATFNAPLAGVFFAMELILVDFAAQSFGMVVLASVTSSAIGRAFFGDHPFLKLPEFKVESIVQYGLFMLLGVIAGVIGVLFTRILYWIEDACDFIWRGPEWLRPAVGGVLFGGLLLLVPQMYGVGYPVINKAMAGKYVIGLLLVLMVAKMVATSLTIGIGGSGGVFAPSLFVGAMLGSTFGEIVHLSAPNLASNPGAYGLIGMAAVFAGAARAPITAAIMMFEITGEYTLILPLMMAVALATGVSHLMTKDTIYTLKLRRRGIDVTAPRPDGVLATITAAQAMRPITNTIAANTDVAEAVKALSEAPFSQLPVVDSELRYIGVITAKAVLDHLDSVDPEDQVSIDKLCVNPGSVAATATLHECVSALGAADGLAMPVTDENADVVGWLTAALVITAMNKHAPSQTDAG